MPSPAPANVPLLGVPITVTPTPSGTPPPTAAATAPPTAQGAATATATSAPPGTPTLVPTHTPIPTLPATATSIPAATATAVSPVAVHNWPRTVRGGRTTVCTVRANRATLQPGCLVLSSVSAGGATVVYTLVYPEPFPTGPGGAGASSTDIFTDTADVRGHSWHLFTVAYQPPVGARHGSPATVVHVTVRATLPDGAALLPGQTRFTVVR